MLDQALLPPPSCGANSQVPRFVWVMKIACPFDVAGAAGVVCAGAWMPPSPSPAKAGVMLAMLSAAMAMRMANVMVLSPG